MLAEIRRIEKTDKETFGVLSLDGQIICWTLERPYLDNKPNVSCIPAGIYVCQRIQSPKFKETFEIMNVPGRTHILFHAGNKVEESLGCVLTGSEIGELDGEKAVLSSSKAFFRFMTALQGFDHFPIKISE